MRERLFEISFDEVGITVQVSACIFEIAVAKARKMFPDVDLGDKARGWPIV